MCEIFICSSCSCVLIKIWSFTITQQSPVKHQSLWTSSNIMPSWETVNPARSLSLGVPPVFSRKSCSQQLCEQLSTGNLYLRDFSCHLRRLLAVRNDSLWIRPLVRCPQWERICIVSPESEISQSPTSFPREATQSDTFISTTSAKCLPHPSFCFPDNRSCGPSDLTDLTADSGSPEMAGLNMARSDPNGSSPRMQGRAFQGKTWRFHKSGDSARVCPATPTWSSVV